MIFVCVHFFVVDGSNTSLIYHIYMAYAYIIIDLKRCMCIHMYTHIHMYIHIHMYTHIYI